MEKVLTVSIAAYNVANFIEETLNSCLVDEYLDKLQVLIVDDGATDNTAEIAERFVKKYPATFELVKKENGGYGTTINSGIKHARGKYFKLLDGDDYFDKDSLKQFIERLEVEQADMVLTKNIEVSDENGEKALPKREWYKYFSKTLNISDMDYRILISMWNVAVKTELINVNPYTFPGRILYTDSLFVANALKNSKTITFYDLDLYQYRVSRIGQSTSPESLKAHSNDMRKVYELICDIYKDAIDKNNPNKDIIGRHVAMMYLNYITVNYTIAERTKEKKSELITLEKDCKINNRFVYDEAGQMSRRIKLLRLTNYLIYRFI